MTDVIVNNDVQKISQQQPEPGALKRLKPQLTAVLIKNFLTFVFGLSLGFPTIVIPAIQQGTAEDPNLVLDKTEISWYGSLHYLCIPIGCIFSGWVSQKFGKRRVMQWLTIPFIMSWVVLYLATNKWYFLLTRIITGFAFGIIETAILTYVAEITEPKFRGTLVGTAPVFLVLGTFLQFLMGAMLHWRTLVLYNLGFPVVSFFLLFLAPESPYWLIRRGRIEEAKAELSRLRAHPSEKKLNEEFETIRAAAEQKPNEVHQSFRDRFNSKVTVFKERKFLMPYTLIMFVFFIGHFSGKTALQTFAVQIFEELKSPINKYQATVLLGLVELIGTFFYITFVRRLGKRPLALVSIIACGLCVFGAASYAFYLNGQSDLTIVHINGTLPLISNDGYNITEMPLVNGTANLVTISDVSHKSWIPMTLMLGSHLFSHMGIKMLPWILIGELYSVSVRGWASSFSGGCGHIIGFFAAKLYLSMKDSLTLAGTLWFYSSVGIIGGIILYFFLPETEGRSLEEIEVAISSGTKIHSKPKRIKKTPNGLTAENGDMKVHIKTENGIDNHAFIMQEVDKTKL